MRRAVRRIGWLWLPAALAACQAAAPLGPTPPAPISVPPFDAQRQTAILSEIGDLLQADYLYPASLDGPYARQVADLRMAAEAGLEEAGFHAGLEQALAVLPAGTVTYLSRQERVQLAVDEGEAISGIGAFIAFRETPQPRLILLSVVDESPAAAAGLAAHDAILGIDGQPVRADEGLAAAERVRGPEGTMVRLEVESPGGPRRFVEVERRRLIPVDRIRARVMSTGSVHLQVPVVADADLVEAVDIALQALADEPEAGGLVIDLRVAGSNSGWPLEPMLGLFLGGRHGEFIGPAGSGPLIVTPRDLRGSQTVPLVVLIGRDTSGAPEIFAAAIQASRRGAVIGWDTRGLVYGYGAHILEDGSLLTYARSTYRPREGGDLGGAGVAPGLRIEADWDQVSDTFDPALGLALELLRE